MHLKSICRHLHILAWHFSELFPPLWQPHYLHSESNCISWYFLLSFHLVMYHQVLLYLCSTSSPITMNMHSDAQMRPPCCLTKRFREIITSPLGIRSALCASNTLVISVTYCSLADPSLYPFQMGTATVSNTSAFFSKHSSFHFNLKNTVFHF